MPGQTPAQPSIYHITHVDNLPSIVRDGCLLSDVAVIARGGPSMAVGMSGIKARRLRLPVVGHPGLMVGACVPFYLCPRSVMLFLLHMGNHAELTYRAGQTPIVHLEADLHRVVQWASGAGVRWALSLSNAGAAYCSFRTSLAGLSDIDWPSVQARDFRDAAVKEGKQAEFLVEERFPLGLVSRIGVINPAVASQVSSCLSGLANPPLVSLQPSWYY